MIFDVQSRFSSHQLNVHKPRPRAGNFEIGRGRIYAPKSGLDLRPSRDKVVWCALSSPLLATYHRTVHIQQQLLSHFSNTFVCLKKFPGYRSIGLRRFRTE